MLPQTAVGLTAAVYVFKKQTKSVAQKWALRTQLAQLVLTKHAGGTVSSVRIGDHRLFLDPQYLNSKMKRRSSILILLILLIMLAIIAGLIYSLQHYYEKAGIEPSALQKLDIIGWSMILSITIGITMSVVLMRHLIMKLLSGRPKIFNLSMKAPYGSKVGAILSGVAFFPVALFVGFIVGGNLGGGLLEMLLGESKVWIMVGIGLGIFIVIVSMDSIAVLIGFLIGGFLEMMLRKVRE
jgi:hypothetical protein